MTREFLPNVFSVGAIDWDRKLFDELVALPGGTSYNSYLVVGRDKVALMDTVDPTKTQEHLDHLKEALAKAGRSQVDYIISNHAEQDHSGSIPAVLALYPNAKVVCNALCGNILKDELKIQESSFQIITDGEELSLGDRTLKFIFTPWVHWPETMCTLLKEDRIIFTGDFFGSHLATSDLYVTDYGEIYDAAKRYYSEIMQPFATIILKNLQKLSAYQLDIIAPTHGPMYRQPKVAIEWYTEWASPKAKREVVVAFASMHGSTARMVQRLCSKLMEGGIKVQEYNLTHSEIGAVAMAMIDASALVIASPTYLTGLHPVVASAVYALNALHPKTKLLGFLGSGEWGGQIAEDFKRFTSNFNAQRLDPVLIKGAPGEAEFAKVDEYAKKIIDAHLTLSDVLPQTAPVTRGVLPPSAAAVVNPTVAPTVQVSEQNKQQTQSPTAISAEYVWNTPAPISKKKQIPRDRTDLTIVLCGEAGQGIQSIQSFLTDMLKEEGYFIFTTKEFMSRIRGGSNSVTLRVSSQPKIGLLERVDVFLPLDRAATAHVENRLSKDTLIIGDKKIVKTDHEVIDVPFADLATKIGAKIYANTIAVGYVLGLFNADLHHFYNALDRKFKEKGQNVVDKNKEAARVGFEMGVAARPKLPDPKMFEIEKHPEAHETVFVDGAEAIGLGAIAGGCNFICAYPMSPSTGVLVYLASHRFEFDIVVEQAEDEIAGINMAIAAWYAGARALANSSGGGFALMCEGLSLAGITETPLVVHIAQRPGPGTGLPTRTAQEDLELALYAGHGEFVRAIYAPGTVEQGFRLTQKAFDLADTYQIPVFVLTDQYFMDTLSNIDRLEIDDVTFTNKIVETTVDYKRYAYTPTGISPRGIPGNGKGIVTLDSDEHDETGHITESMQVRNSMVAKRMARFAAVQQAVLPPERIGAPLTATNVLVISWGTTYGSVREAVERLASSGRKDITYLHFTQIFPLHKDMASWLLSAKQVVVVENNATGQFAKLIRRETGILCHRVLKYDGMPFSVEELMGELEAIK